MHIAGILLRVRPEQMESVRCHALNLNGVELHADDKKGRLVVTIEAEDRHRVAETIFKLDSIDHVLSSSMVYEESEYDH